MHAGDILVSQGLLDDAQLRLAQQAQNGESRLDQVAVELGFVTEHQVLAALGSHLGIEVVDLTKFDADQSLLDSFPTRLIYRHGVFPLSRHNGSLVVASSDPFDLCALDEISSATGLTVEHVLAARDEIDRLVKAHLGVGSETIDGLMARSDESQQGQIELLNELELDDSQDSEMAREASVVRLVNEILVEAIEAHASDIHVESQAAGLRVRYRIDGILQTQPTPPQINRFQAAIISRLKIMARLNIAEKRLPQDGRIKVKVSGREVDIRVSIIPMTHGESIVMRVLDKDRMNFTLAGVGLDDETYEKFSELVRLPHGIVLVTGPTGSGKTTTLYSALAEIQDATTKIITTEDPVEYQLDGVNQIQVHPKIGLTFAISLRAILRHDPDVVLVGEIRDLETAENAVQASLTGHLVFSTLHTNDAAGAFMRLCDMGVEPFLVASTLEGVMAQRLVRKLCPECRQPYQPTADDVPRDFPLAAAAVSGEPIFRAVGCRNCRGTGYAGRAGLFELLITSDDIRQLAIDRAGSHSIRDAAIRSGMCTLRQDGWRKVIAGSTSIDEVLRVTRADH